MSKSRTNIAVGVYQYTRADPTSIIDRISDPESVEVACT